MSLMDNYFNHVPDYYPYMYLDGYTPEEIMQASNQKPMKNIKEREAAKAAEADVNEFPEVKIISEVKIK